MRRYFARRRLFKALFKHRAAVIKGHILCVRSIHCVGFLVNELDAYDFDTPAPEHAERVKAYDDGRTDPKTEKSYAELWPSGSKIPTDGSVSCLVSDEAVDVELGRLLTALLSVFGHCDWAEGLVERADGCGLTFLALLREKAKKATVGDRSLAMVPMGKMSQE